MSMTREEILRQQIRKEVLRSDTSIILDVDLLCGTVTSRYGVAYHVTREIQILIKNRVRRNVDRLVKNLIREECEPPSENMWDITKGMPDLRDIMLSEPLMTDLVFPVDLYVTMKNNED